MSVNISVSGKTLKECQEQILAIAEEICNDQKQDCKDPIVSQPQPIVGNGFPGSPAPVQNVVKFPIAPEVTTPVAQTVSHGNEVDSRGLPWDSRIHSSNREKSNDGKWRKRRGVDEMTVAQVEAELLGKAPAKTVPPFGSMAPEQYQQVVAPAPAPMPTTEHRVALPASPDLLSAAQIPATPAPSFAPPMQAAVLPPNTHNAESFRNNLMNILNDLAAAGKINHDWINAQKVQFGGKDVTQWHENATACNSLFEAFVGWGLVNKL